MASQSTSGSHIELYDSTLTVPSDSENYSANNELSSSPASSSSSPLTLYRPPTIWSLLRGAAINLILPFVNGLMLGLGELVAHETAFRLGWSGTKTLKACRTLRSRFLQTRQGLTLLIFEIRRHWNETSGPLNMKELDIDLTIGRSRMPGGLRI